MSIERIVTIEFDFGGDQDCPPLVTFKRTDDECDPGHRMTIPSYASVHRLERATAGWPAYVEIDNHYVILKRPCPASQQD